MTQKTLTWIIQEKPIWGNIFMVSFPVQLYNVSSLGMQYPVENVL